MPRKKKGADVEERVKGYLKEYELDEMNAANDMAALRRMCQYEVDIEQLQDAISGIQDVATKSKQMRDLHAALKDANSSWVALQQELGIGKSKRQSENEETPLTYIERLKEQSKKFMDVRLKKVVCPNCQQTLGKYYFYVTDKGEPGSIASTIKKIEPYVYSIKIECWKCNKLVEVNNEGARVS
jgi:hypothetical protein